MSVRAYKIIVPAQIDDTPSFNLWRNEGLVDFFSQRGFHDRLSNEANGIAELQVEDLQDAIEALKSGEIKCENEEECKDLIKSLQEDIDWAIENKNEYIQYECF